MPCGERSLSGGGLLLLAGLCDDAAHGLGGTRAHAHPVIGAIQFDGKIVTRPLGIVIANDFDESPVARLALVGDDDFVIRVIPRPLALESDCYCHDV